MDETEKKAQDTHPEGQAPEASGGNTPPETYTQAQLEEAVDKAVQKARIKAGRDAKALEVKDAAIKAREDAIKEREARLEESETEKYRDNPDGLKALQEKRRQKSERDEIARQKAEVEAEKTANAEKLTRADELELELNVYKAAQAQGVDAEELKTKCDKFKLKDEDAILELAETIARA